MESGYVLTTAAARRPLLLMAAEEITGLLRRYDRSANPILSYSKSAVTKMPRNWPGVRPHRAPILVLQQKRQEIDIKRRFLIQTL